MKFTQIAQMLFIMVAAALVYGFVATAKEGELRRSCEALCSIRPHYAGEDKRMPSFKLKNLQGKEVDSASYAGKVVILNFWSKTCPPCLEEMPSIAELGNALEGRDDIVLVTITTDESAEDARNTLASVLGGRIPFEVLIDSENNIVGDKFGTKLYPETWFIDPRGVIRARVDGKREWNSPVALELAEALRSPMSCPVRARGGQFVGEGAQICGG